MIKPKYKPGDRVRILSRDSKFWHYKGIVLGYTEKGYVRVGIDRREDRVSISEELLEPLGCDFCDKHADIPIKSNADLSRTIALVAQGDKNMELVLSVNGTAYGVELRYCPFCGRRFY